MYQNMYQDDTIFCFVMNDMHMPIGGAIWPLSDLVGMFIHY